MAMDWRSPPDRLPTGSFASRMWMPIVWRASVACVFIVSLSRKLNGPIFLMISLPKKKFRAILSSGMRARS